MPDLTNITDTLPDGSTVTSLVAEHDHGGLDANERFGLTHDTWHEGSSSQPPDPAGPPQAWLDLSVASVTTPDPGPPPAQCCLVYRGRHVPGGDVLHTIAAQFEPAGQESWMVQRLSRDGNMTASTTDGVGYGAHQSSIGPMTDKDVLAGAALDFPNTDVGRFRGWITYEGAWHPGDFKSPPATTVAIKDSTGPLRIGAFGSGQSQKFVGRLYWVELRTGLYPDQGTVIWRFDAADWVSGTSWTDPRGRTWTMTAAGAIKPPD